MVLPLELIGYVLAKHIIDADHRQTGFVHQPLFDGGIEGHRAVTVEMVGGEIGQYPDAGGQRGGQIDLETRTFDHMHAGFVGWRQRQNSRADIAARGDITARHLQQMGNQSGGGGFAIGAGDRDARRIGSDQGSLAEEQFDIADDFDAGFLRLQYNRMRSGMGQRHTGRQDQRVLPVQPLLQRIGNRKARFCGLGACGFFVIPRKYPRPACPQGFGRHQTRAAKPEYGHRLA